LGEVPKPMSATLMGRLFVVPAIIVCVLLVLAVVVVLFGTTSIEGKQESIADLLTKIESDPGERTLGSMLMPRSRESWQAAQELAKRFQQKEKYLKPEEIEPTAARIIAAVDHFGVGRDTDEPGSAQQYFLMMALARLESPSAVPLFVKSLKDPNWCTRKTAMQALADMHKVPQARQVVGDILPLLEDRRPEVQMVACAAVASLAERGDATAIKAVAARLESDREVQWNAAMTLARLGSPLGKLVLMNMLDRRYWEEMELSYREGGSEVRRKYSESEVAGNLKSAIEASAGLIDANLKSDIAKLEKDKSVIVRDAARAAQRRDDGAKSAQRGALNSVPRSMEKIEA
jgi:HEAT repeat protein